MSSIASGLSSTINANASLQGVGISAQSSAAVINVKFNPVNYPQFAGSSIGGATESISLAMNNNVNQVVLIGGTKTTGDVLSITVNDIGPFWGQQRRLLYSCSR